MNGIIESRASIDITCTEGRGELYIKEYIKAYEIKFKNETDCGEIVWCNIMIKH